MKKLATEAYQPEIALLVSTYQKPEHLRRVLLSIALQEGLEWPIEVVVTDDGSTDRTWDVVEAFERDVPFPVSWTTHPHEGFQLARCRNEGVAASSAPYLLFLDGDCILPRDHVRQHLIHRRAGWVMGGYCCRLDAETSARIDDAAIRANTFPDFAPPSEFRKLTIRDRKARFYNLIRHPGKPKLAGGNIGIWREDFAAVNGYDQKFVGWGGEDDDLRRRLAATGVHVGSILRWTHTYHLWHPPEPTAVSCYWDGQNVSYLHRHGRLICCRHGFVQRPLEAIGFQIIGQPHAMSVAQKMFAKYLPEIVKEASPRLSMAARSNGTIPTESKNGHRAEVEILISPGGGQFSGRADCQVLVILPGTVPSSQWSDRTLRKQIRQAHRLLCDVPQDGFIFGETQFGLDQVDRLLESIT